MPAAAAPERSSRFLTSEYAYLENMRADTLATQHAMCTYAASSPTLIPDAIASTRATLLMTNVRPPRYPFITKPPRIVLISGIPEPDAKGAKVRTNQAAQTPNNVAQHM